MRGHVLTDIHGLVTEFASRFRLAPRDLRTKERGIKRREYGRTVRPSGTRLIVVSRCMRKQRDVRLSFRLFYKYHVDRVVALFRFV